MKHTKLKGNVHLYGYSGRRLLSLVAGMLLCLSSIFAQDQKTLLRIEGTVRDQAGAPIIGAQIIEQGSQIGTSTNEKGHFTIRVESADVRLQISCIGMETLVVPVVEDQQMSITLKEDAAMLDEVVAIGYGTSKKSDLTGSVVSIKGEELENRLSTSVEDALRGRIAGVAISSANGEPGETINLRIRGTGSLNASNAPLYVVDGVPLDDASDINSNDISSMQILKDASATAIYGSRGANGVVLITTKTGEKGKARINIQYTGGFQTPVRLIDMCNNWEYQKTQYIGTGPVSKNRAFRGDYTDYTVGSTLTAFHDSDGNVWIYPNNQNWQQTQNDPTATNTNWQDVMLRNTWVHDFRANVSGGTDMTKYSIMGSYFSQQGMVIHSGYQRFSLRANFTQNVSRDLKLGFNISGQKSKNEGAITSDNDGTIMNMLTQLPTRKYDWDPAGSNDSLDDDGNPIDNSGDPTQIANSNPWWQATHVTRNTYKTNITSKLNLDWMITPFWRLNVSGSYTDNTSDRNGYLPKGSNGGLNSKGTVSNVHNGKENWLNENLLYYTPRDIGRHHYDLMGGVTFSENNSKKINSSAQGFDFENLGEYGWNLAQVPILPTYTNESYRMASFLGRGNYSYNNRYLFTASIRADGSSRFGKDHKWGYFPSGAFAWRISEERFVKYKRWISNLKLRTSVGVSGNTDFPPYQTLPMLDVVNVPMSSIAGHLNTGLLLDRPANPNLKWETSTQYDAGLDWGFLGNRINGVIDTYYKRTRDLLMLENTPPSTGYTSRWTNVGAVDNRGLEITINGIPIQQRNFRWDVSYNMAFNRSKIVSLGRDSKIYLTPGSGSIDSGNYAILQVGQPVGTFYGLRTDGWFRSYAEIAKLAAASYKATGIGYNAFGFTPPTGTSADEKKSNIIPGMIRYVDTNGDGQVTDADRVILGCGQPKFTGGMQNTFSYNQFRLSVDLEFSYGRKIFNSTGLSISNGTGNKNVTRDYLYNSWAPDLYYPDGTLFMKGNEENAKYPGFIVGLAGYNNYMKDTDIQDGSYLRIANVTFSYSFSKTLLNKLHLSGMSVFVGVNNLYVFTRYTGFDPDVNSVTNSYADLVPGVDSGTYPRARVFNAGWNITF